MNLRASAAGLRIKSTFCRARKVLGSRTPTPGRCEFRRIILEGVNPNLMSKKSIDWAHRTSSALFESGV